MEKVDYAIVGDEDCKEQIEILGDWIDGSGHTSCSLYFDSVEMMEFPVRLKDGFRQAKAVIVAVTDNFQPIRIGLRVWEAIVPKDARSTKGQFFLVALDRPEETEVTGAVSVVDAWSGDANDRRARFVKSVIQFKKPAVRKRTATKKTSTTVNQSVGKARDVIQAGGNVNIVKKVTVRNEVVPGERHITEEQAAEVQRMIEELAHRLTGADGKPAFGQAQQRLKNKFKVTSYRLIPRERFSEVVAWFKQVRGMNMGKVRRSNPELFKRDHYTSIKAGARSLGWSDEELYAFAREFLNRKAALTSLTQLGPIQLQRLSQAIQRRRKK